jgi:hypothetical protein
MEPNSQELVENQLPEYQPYSGVIKCVPNYKGRGGMMGPAEWTLVFYSEEDAQKAMSGEDIHNIGQGPREDEIWWGRLCLGLWIGLSLSGSGLFFHLLWSVIGIFVLPLLALPPVVFYYMIDRIFEWGERG